VTASTDRRRFIQGAGAGMLGLIGFFYPGLADVARARGGNQVTRVTPGLQADGTTVLVAQGIDPTYAEGQVSSITGDRVTLATVAETRAVVIGPSVEVWKEITGGIELVSLGDWLDVKGVPQSDGSLQATSGMVFVNIGRLDGTLRATTADTMTIDAYGTTRTVELSPTLEAVHKEDGSAYAGGVHSFPVGAAVGAVGLRLPNSGFRATRVWI